MLPGVQVGIWGTATGSTNAQVSVYVQNSQTGLWLNADGTWSVQTWFSAPIVDAAGTWRWMYTPAGGGSFTVVAQVMDGAATGQASSTFSVLGGSSSTPVPPASPASGTGTFPLKVVNGTAGCWANSDIWLTIIGQATPGTWAYGGDTSQVDQFGFPIDVEVEQQSTGFDQSTTISTTKVRSSSFPTPRRPPPLR